MENLVSGLIGAIIGSAIGFAGTQAIEHRKELLRSRAVVSSILLEMTLLSAALKTTVLEQKRTRTTLRRDFWDKNGAELINYLPDEVTRMVHLLMVDMFDIVQNGYHVATSRDMTSEEERAIGSCLLGWAYRTELLVDKMYKHGQRPRGLKRQLQQIRDGRAKRQTFDELLAEVEGYAAKNVEAHGYSLEEPGVAIPTPTQAPKPMGVS